MADTLVDDIISGSFSGVEPELDIKPGDRVRSYDFAGNLTCYAEGVVEAITEPLEGCPRYRIVIDKRVMDGRLLAEHEGVVFPPVNGTPTWLGRITNYVVRVAH